MHGELSELMWREGEPAQSFASRLAAHYGCSSVQEFLADFDISHRRLASGRDHEVQSLSDLTGTDLTQLRSATPRSNLGSVSFGSETFSLYYSRRKRIVGCPECINEDISRHPRLIPEAAAYLRQHWLLSPMMTCSRHRRPLMGLGSDLGFQQRYDYALRMDGIADHLPVLLADPNRREASEFEHYVAERLSNSEMHEGWLDALALNELFGICSNLGLTVLNLKKGFLKLKEVEQHATYQAGFAVLKSGREGLRDLFTDMINTRVLKLPLGPASLLGRTYTALLGSRSSWPKYQPILDNLANAVYDVLPYGPEDVPLFNVPITYRCLYSPRDAGREFGIVPKTLLGYALANGAASISEVASQNGARKWTTIDAKAAERLFRQPFEHEWRKRLRSMGLTTKAGCRAKGRSIEAV